MTSRIPKTLLFLVILALFVGHISKAQVLDYTTKIKIEKGKKITEKTFLIQIKNKENNWLSHIEVSHGPDDEFTLMEAKVIDSKGNIVKKLRKKDISTKSDLSHGTFYQDDLVEEFDLYWNDYPYQIEYSYRISEEEFIYITKWYPLVNTKVITEKSSLHVEVPSIYEISLDYPDEIQYLELNLDDKKIYQWNYGQIKSPKPESHTKPLEELVPYVSVVPLEFEYGVPGSSKSWSSFGTWQMALNRGTDQLPASEKSIIDKLINGIDDKQQIVKTLYQYLQDKTKYVNVAIDVGGLKSYPASYVCENKYGDCKALTTYMKAMLSYVDIKSYYTTINAGSNAARINKNFPSQQFNHVILSVPMEKDTIWLENTSNSLPFNYLGTFTQDRYALMIKGEGSELIRTPKLDLSEVLEKRTFNFDHDGNGIWHVSISETLGGEAFESYRYYKSQISSKEQKEKVVSDITIKNFEPNKWEIINGKREDQNINIVLSGICGSQIRKIGKLKVIKPLQLKIPNFEKPNKRNLGVRINYPTNKSDSIVYRLPNLKNYEVQLPDNIDLKSPFGTYQVTYEQCQSALVVREYFQLHSGDYPIEEYPKFYSFINAITNYKKASAIILQ
ncbi:MAG: DUF3857 domain-containing protein [Maribacter sp.]|nr:DUF3857 domain-containing protein [Maribacter sp.]